jgi:hypothetical protein
VWTQTAGTPVVGTPGGTVAAPTFTFTAPNTAGALSFTLTATDSFGSGTGFVNVNVLAASDIVQITVATFAVQRGKVGPFGKLNVTATSSDPTATLTLIETPVESPTIPPSCPLNAPVAGGTCNWGTGTEQPLGVYNWIESKGAPQPASLTVTSTKGGSATQSCGAPNGKGTVTCP